MNYTVEQLASIVPALRWTPQVGEYTLGFKKRKTSEEGGPDEDALNLVILEAQTILGRCLPPSATHGGETGLVIGYVQSGKTLSFTTVMALARDNNFRMVILLAGTATNLKSQSERRVAKDLGIGTGDKNWIHFQNPDSTNRTNIQNALDIWSNPKVASHKRRAIFITVLKQRQRLGNLNELIGQLNLIGVPTLIIDDEGDQASLNTKAAKNVRNGTNETSITYDWIVSLKAQIPHHTFLQYTATPQANLLISIADVLSPSFAELVTPGHGYVGGQEVFENVPPLVEPIPVSDIPTAQAPLLIPPQSLLSSLRFFLLGAATHTTLRQRGTRSMMIHPSRITAPHGNYKRWVEDTFEAWKVLFNLASEDDAYKACVELFRPEYASLRQTFLELPSFEQLIHSMPAVFLTTSITELNRTPDGEQDINWDQSDYWILVGGQKLDRGFTVEGLTVTYMPRPAGSRSADTIQQRARFLGYKRNYQGLCRIFLIEDLISIYQDYVEHEEFVRTEIEKFRGRPLIEWKRDFLLSANMNPTRKNVIGIAIRHIAFTQNWYSPKAFFKDVNAVTHNRVLWGNLASDLIQIYGSQDANLEQKYRDNRPNSPSNVLIRNVPLREILEKFFLKIRIPDAKDSEEITAVIIAINQLLKLSTTVLSDVFLIANLQTDNQFRTVVDGKINQVFQGETVNYVGDRALFNPERSTLHLRVYNLGLPPGVAGVVEDVPWFSLWLRDDDLKDSVIQRE